MAVIITMAITPTATAQIDYSSQVQPIFNAECTSCHGSSGGVNLSSYNALMNSNGNNYGSSVVVAGDPESSGLVDKIEANPQIGNRMPTNGPYLSTDDINTIRQWITEGANEVPTSNDIDKLFPSSFRLIGNYPNPFNPSTNIEFEMSESAQYTISVYSIHGQLLMEHIGFANSGVANIPIHMQYNPTGVYLYKVSILINGQTNVIGTGRMTLIK
jgi:mono/diheme cytochrome c family protein